MIKEILITSVLALSTAAFANDNTPIAKPALVELNQNIQELSTKVNDLSELANRLNSENSEIKNSIASTIEATKIQISQVQQTNAEIVGYLKQQKLDYESLEVRDVDIAYSVETDYYAVWVNFFAVAFSILGSLRLSYIFLRSTLRKETKIQILAIQIDAKKRKNEHDAMLTAQQSHHKEQLHTQRTISEETHKEQHQVVINEFRQKWSNNFRDGISSYISNVSQILRFYEVEVAMLNRLKNLKRAEEDYISYTKDLDKRDLDKKHLASLLEEEIEARLEFESVKGIYLELNNLEFKLAEQKTKICLMLNSTKEINVISELLKTINRNVIITDKRVYRVETNRTEIKNNIVKLEEISLQILKKEWNQIQRKGSVI